MPNEDRLLRVENSLSTLVELAQKADERKTRIEEAQLRAEERWKQNEERWKRNEERWGRNETRWERTEQSVRSLLAIAEIHEREITATNEQLNALIIVVERYISERRDGRTS